MLVIHNFRGEKSVSNIIYYIIKIGLISCGCTKRLLLLISKLILYYLLRYIYLIKG